MASATALYRLQPQPPQGGRGGGDGGDGGARLERMAGDEDEHGTADGQGWEARFCSIQDIFADAEGALYILDKVRGEDGGRACTMRRMAPDGTVTTLASGLKIDLGALLDGQPEGSWDVTIVVGDRRFPAHRLILSARSDYFGSRLSRGKFADGAAAELSLPDADPDVFELLLRYIYTGAADIPPALAPAVAVLADRLLLPLLCADAQAAVLSAVTAESVAESLLWAERLGDGFSGLLSSLKAWFLEHFEEVHEAAPGSLERLSAESPKLMVELHLGVARSAKRQRTG
ncbi:hypothetical protein HYH03_015525 [Edaphochlamys debaryana]|uniref:BTB domain-containing protein n=1 Tax=Edaphochlamys debaryana TaxID=47281 RepID=A0A836BR53_9CHLO|nr:hypothetical protein HYH03_015525 [Edaphochlamys debaryana]|eukprot:KAG2485815.1 hypothetical protein HYH03_015525 [Edaphochlamys debaryana]